MRHGRAPHIALIQASIEALPFRDRCADLTVCGLTIGHLPSLEPALAELQRITHTNGPIVCSDFHPLQHERGGRREFTVGGERYAVRHTPHYIEDWRRACAAVGLRIVRVLEPLLDPKDIRGPVRFDLTTVKLPVVTVFELSSASRAGR